MEKIKNLSALRLVAFAVAVAILLGLSSVMLSFTASAESVSDIPSSITGTFGNYNAVKFTASNQIFDPSTIFTEFDTKSYIGVFVYEKNGKLTVYDDLFSYVSNGSMFLDFANTRISSPDNTMFYILKTDRFKDSSSEQAVYFNNYVMLFADKSTFNYSDLEANLPLNTFPIRAVTFDSFCDLYLIYTTTSGILSQSECKAKIADMTSDVNKMSISQWQGSDSSNFPNAKFVTCASYTNDDGSFPLWCKSFVAEGQQYPLFTYFIKDNGNKHKYSLVLSYNNNDVAGALCTALYDKLTNDMWRTSLKIPSLSYVSAHIFPMHNAGDMMVKAVLRYFESGWKNATFSQSFNLNGSDMDFSNSVDSGNKVYTLCLSDYSAIVAGQIYKVEIWDNTVSEILDTTYFVSRDSFGKSNSGTGVKIYDYKDDGARMEKDIINNTPSVTPGTGSDFKTTGDIEWSQFNDDLTNVDITSIFSSLHSAINSVGVFFQACWAIIPSSIFALLLSGLSLIIVLRVLGR